MKSNSFNSLFSTLHIAITPGDKRPVSYSLTYSSGKHEMYLENGRISSHQMFTNSYTTFYYENPVSKGKIKSKNVYFILTVN